MGMILTEPTFPVRTIATIRIADTTAIGTMDSVVMPADTISANAATACVGEARERRAATDGWSQQAQLLGTNRSPIRSP